MALGPIERYLHRLRRRATVLVWIRALWFALGAGAPVFLLASLATGPVASATWALFAWSLVLLSSAAAGYLGARPGAMLRGNQVASLLAEARPELASSARSAVELRGLEGVSTGLVRAHASEVERALRAIPINDVVPWPWLRSPPPISAFVLGALALLAAGLFDGAATGAFALLHPGAQADGTSLADLVSEVEAELLYPSYMDREARVVPAAGVLEAPRGTTVRWSARPHVDVLRASLRVGDQTVRLDLEGQRLRGRFVVRESGSLEVLVRDTDGRDLKDATRCSVRILEDEPPRVTLLEPTQDLTIDLEETVDLRYEAQDDVGLGLIELVVETAEGETIREGQGQLEGTALHQGLARLLPVELGARPGDALRIWIEARDGDVVSGPNVGSSETRTITIASEATRRAESIADLRATLDAGIAALADRLEAPLSDMNEEQARRRYEHTLRSATHYREFLQAQARGNRSAPVDPSVLADMHQRLDRTLNREQRLYEDALAASARRERADTSIVALLEDQVLLLSDMVGRARLDDAAAIARELESLRREMTSLLAELRRAESPEARRRLLGALRRARARLDELAARLGAMGEDVPGEFLNPDAMPDPDESERSLDALEDALERNDLESAERSLMEFEREIEALARSLGGASQSFAEARFGPRQRAMAEAMDRLAGLETEERQLSGRSETLRREAASRALRAGGADNTGAEALADDARAARETIGEVAQGSLGPLNREAFDRARQRLEDTADALAAGDLGEARSMAQEATDDAERLARDLELSALMFPGREGQVGDAAQAAREAADRARRLEHDIDRAIPRLSEFLRDPQRDQMRADSQRQRRATGAARQLAEAFEAEPDGAPLSPEGARAMESVGEAMQRARQALDRGDPVEASQQQEEAARQLGELREQLEQQQQQQQQGGGGGQGGGAPDLRQRVLIPRAEDAQETPALRRRLLDAMRQDAPQGYEHAVRRYYEELLR